MVVRGVVVLAAWSVVSAREVVDSPAAASNDGADAGADTLVVDAFAPIDFTGLPAAPFPPGVAGFPLGDPGAGDVGGGAFPVPPSFGATAGGASAPFFGAGPPLDAAAAVAATAFDAAASAAALFKASSFAAANC